jgi:hypothetical protein
LPTGGTFGLAAICSIFATSALIIYVLPVCSASPI